jgi:GNAT superfamily N-acetyltransferase
MPYEIDITPVGPNEYPLIRVLHGTIFQICPPADRPDIEPALCEEGIQLLGHLEGNPLGFLAAVREKGAIRILGCGVMKEYRRQGIGGRMLQWVEMEADARRQSVEAVVGPIYLEMIALLRRREYGQQVNEFVRKRLQSNR